MMVTQFRDTHSEITIYVRNTSGRITVSSERLPHTMNGASVPSYEMKGRSIAGRVSSKNMSIPYPLFPGVIVQEKRNRNALKIQIPQTRKNGCLRTCFRLIMRI